MICGRAWLFVVGAGLCACSLAVETGGLAGGPDADAGSDAATDAAIADAAVGDGGGGDAADAGDGAFVDTFTRADGTLGNGWIEKRPGAFGIAGNRVLFAPGGLFRDVLVRRPPSEDALNVEVAIECVVASYAQVFPQVHVRVQASTVSTPGTLDSYGFYLDGATNVARISKLHGSNDPVTLTLAGLSRPLGASERFRLTLRVTGTSPVVLEASLDSLAGSTPTRLAQAAALDSAPDRIKTAGSVGFSGDAPSSFMYDDFRRQTLSSP